MDSHKAPNGDVDPISEQTEVVTVNFKDGSVLEKVKFDADAGATKFLRELAKHARKTKVKSVMVVTVDENDLVDWIHLGASEHHLALIALCLEDMKDELKELIFVEGSN